MPPDLALDDTDSAERAARKAAYLEDYSINVALDLAEDARAFGRILLERANTAPAEEAIRLAAAFERTSRAARRAVLLARLIYGAQAKSAAARPKPDGAPAAQPRQAAPEGAHRPGHDAQPDTLARPDTLETAERPDSLADDVAAVSRRPLAAVVAAIEDELLAARTELEKPLVKPSGPIGKRRFAVAPKPWERQGDDEDDDHDDDDDDEDDERD